MPSRRHGFPARLNGRTYHKAVIRPDDVEPFFMPGSITPLPVMLEEEEALRRFEAAEPPKSIVCRYGSAMMVAELPYDGGEKPGCGTKLVIRTRRGTELAEMLTSTCANAGCSKSVSRKEMLEYIESSGGKKFPFSNQGRVLRMATAEDLSEQSQLDERKPEMIRLAKSIVQDMQLDMRIVDVELLLGGDRVIFYYTAEQWVEFRELVKRLGSEYQARIEMHQVNAREEARLIADYERCGQYCCCKSFLKVLKPVSMRSAKVQKATLDPSKISGRCGRLMCCLRYEDQTYESLRKRLPHRQKRVMTDEGLGTVVDTQILTQLVLVRLDTAPKPAAYPLENIRVVDRAEEERIQVEVEAKRVEAETEAKGPPRGSRRRRSKPPAGGASASAPADAEGVAPKEKKPPQGSKGGGESKPTRSRRRRSRRRGKPREGGQGGGGTSDS